MVFGLFKKKLNVKDHLWAINYMITLEASEQWKFHVEENNFDKKCFRSLNFSKEEINFCIKVIFNIQADDHVLSFIADLAYRKCIEWIDDYNSFHNIAIKWKKDKFIREMAKYLYYIKRSSSVENACLQAEYRLNVGDGFGVIQNRYGKCLTDFQYIPITPDITDNMSYNFDVHYMQQKFIALNILNQIKRYGHCLANISDLSPRIISDDDVKLFEKESSKYVLQSEKEREKMFDKLENEAGDIFLIRNKNNEFQTRA